jgi:hypothetical protein
MCSASVAGRSAMLSVIVRVLEIAAGIVIGIYMLTYIEKWRERQ